MTETIGTEVIRVVERPEEFFLQENLYGRILSDTPNATAVFARIRPREQQSHHVQNRPNGGDEVLFLFGGQFEVRTATSVSGPFTADPENPVFIYVKSGDALSIRNVGDSDLCFFTVLAPGYKEGEITYLE